MCRAYQTFNVTEVFTFCRKHTRKFIRDLGPGQLLKIHQSAQVLNKCVSKHQHAHALVDMCMCTWGKRGGAFTGRRCACPPVPGSSELETESPGPVAIDTLRQWAILHGTHGRDQIHHCTTCIRNNPISNAPVLSQRSYRF
jgi:hypothetical protein